MARKRMIDPDFWSDEELADMRFETRLLYIGLWNFADDNGNLPFKPRQIRAQVFPYNPEIDIDDSLGELLGAEKIIPYMVNGAYFIHVLNFLKHQTIQKPTCKYPEFREEYRTTTGPLQDHYGSNALNRGNNSSLVGVQEEYSTPLSEWNGKEVIEKKGGERARAREENPPSPDFKYPAGWKPTEESRDKVDGLLHKIESIFGVWPFNSKQIGNGEAAVVREELAAILRLLTADEVVEIVRREMEARVRETKGADRPVNLKFYMRAIKYAFYARDRQLEDEERRRDEEKKRKRRDPADEPVSIGKVLEKELSPEERAARAAKFREIKERIAKAGRV